MKNKLRPLFYVTLFIFTSLASGCASVIRVVELDILIDRETSRLEAVSQELKSEAPSSLITTHDLQAELKYRPLNVWLSEVTIPELMIQGIGVDARDDIVYIPNVGKAWLEPAHDTKSFLHIRDAVISGDSTGLTWSAQASADAQARAKFSIFKIGGNVWCSGAIPAKAIQGRVNFLPLTGTTLPYSMSISLAEELKVKVGCGLGRLGNVDFEIPAGSLSSDLSKGTIDLGLSTSGEMNLPAEAGGKKFRYIITPVNPIFITSNQSLSVRTNIDVVVEEQ